MLKKLTDLISVKSIITIMTFGVFSYLSVLGKIDTKDFMVVMMMVVTFYFAKKDITKE